LLGGGWLWLRHSPLVSVDRVTVTGVSGAQAEQIRAALTNAARGMTTLDVRTATLRAAVSSYPVVKGLRVSTGFPHDLHIAVSEQLPVAVVTVGTRQVPVAPDGTLLDEGEASGSLPTLALKAMPGGSTIEDPIARLELRVLAASPPAMLTRITGVSANYWHGVVISVRQGPSLYFGGGDRLAAKWQAAMAVLSAASTAGASYIDVTDPQRPAAGPANASSATTSTAGTTGASGSTTTSTTSSTGG
jgi:cell division protein FtsQ